MDLSNLTKYACYCILGLVPNEGQFPIATGKDRDLMSTGPMCRYMDDILPMLKIMAGTNKQANLDKKVPVYYL